MAHRRGRHERVATVLEARRDATVDELLAEVYGDVTERQLPVARFSLWAHLRALVAEGRASCGTPPGEDTLESRWTAA